MKLMFFFCSLVSFALLHDKMEFDFGDSKSGMDWLIVNDGVMGGLSESSANLTKNTMRFVGNVSLENNGGFASLRSPFQQFDLSSFDKVEIRYRSKGQGTSICLETSRQFFRPNYKYYLPPTEWEWQMMTIGLEEFGEYVLGRATGDKVSPQILEKIIRIGFITANKKAGQFEIEFDYLKFTE